MKIDTKKIKSCISYFKDKRILVVGDLILDHYVYGEVDRVSPEAPVPVVWAHRENFVCGGAANVGLNLIALGARVSLCGVLGNDHFGEVLLSLIRKNNIDTHFVITERNRPTTLKTRVIGNRQQVVRVDWESTEFLDGDINKKVLRKVKNNIAQFDAIIIEDYGKGVINPELVRELVSLCHDKEKIITVDPKEEHFDYYKNVTALTPNLKEAQVMANFKIRNKEEIAVLADIILKALHPEALLITLGEDGIMLFADNKSYHIPTMALEVFDVTGAGDTVISVFTLMLASGASYYEATMAANYAAGIVVAKAGAATVTCKELLKRIQGV